MRLALRLGRTVREMLATMSSYELTLWRAFDVLEPVGDWRHDLGHAVVASTMANIHRGKNTQAMPHRDFMPLAPKPKPKTLGQQIREALMRKAK